MTVYSEGVGVLGVYCYGLHVMGSGVEIFGLQRVADGHWSLCHWYEYLQLLFRQNLTPDFFFSTRLESS